MLTHESKAQGVAIESFDAVPGLASAVAAAAAGRVQVSDG